MYIERGFYLHSTQTSGRFICYLLYLILHFGFYAVFLHLIIHKNCKYFLRTVARQDAHYWIELPLCGVGRLAEFVKRTARQRRVFHLPTLSIAKIM